MKIYKVRHRSKSGRSYGYSYTSSKLQAAKKNVLDDYSNPCENEIELIEVKPTKRGIIEALNRHASHNDNG